MTKMQDPKNEPHTLPNAENMSYYERTVFAYVGFKQASFWP